MADNLVRRVYSGFRGVDFRGSEVNFSRSPDSLNMWRDYKKTEGIETRPEMKMLVGFTERVYGIFFFMGHMIVHSGKKLYKVDGGVKTEIYADMAEHNSDAFVYNRDNLDGNPNNDTVIYIKDGKNYLMYNGTEVTNVHDNAYIPTTTIGRKPNGGGTRYEDVNMLTPWRKNSFLSDGSTVYHLDVESFDKNSTVEVWWNDKKVTNYTVDYTKGTITFNSGTVPTHTATDGQDDVVIKFSKTVSGYRDVILKCTMLQVFDNRVFFSGNPDYPNVVYHSGLYDPSYCGDYNYYKEGLDSAAVKGLVAGNNALWVFREPSDANTTVFYHTPTLDAEYGKIYPSTHSSITTGCIGKAVNFNDDIVFFSERGMEGISGDVTTEQVVGHRSSLIDSKLISENAYKDMVLAEWEGYLLVFVGNKAYLADSRAMIQNENHYEYEWFYWEMPKVITCAKVQDGILYLGTVDGVYTLTDRESDVESYWVTPKDKFNYPNMQKTSSKRGGIAEGKGKEISVYAMINTEREYGEPIATFDVVEDAFVYRIKKKKWKDIQLKFYSPKGFSLESAILEAFIGGYLKNI